MSLKFWLGPAGSGKSTKLYNYMIEESIKHPEMLYYIIVPEQANLQTQQELVRLHPRKGILNMDVLSFNRLAHRIFEETGYGSDGGRVIDDMGKNLVLRRVSQLNKEALPMLGENLNRLGYITQVKSVISEFMQYGIGIETARMLSKEASDSNKGQLSAKLSDVALLYESFLSFIKDHYTTREELMIRLSKTLHESDKIKQTVIAFDGFTGFTPVQIEVLQQLLTLCPEVHIVLNLDKRGMGDEIQLKEHELFYMSKSTILKLGRLADECQVIQDDPYVIMDEIPVRFTPSMLSHLEKNLFREKPEKCENTDDSLHIMTTLGPDEELELVAREISRLIREEDYRYNEIAIITGDIESYRSNVERALLRHGIPYFTDKTQPVLLNPMIEFLRAAISVLSDNYSYESVFRFLKTGFADVERSDIDEFENYVLALGVHGRSRYQKTFGSLPQIYKKRSPEFKAQYLMKINKIRGNINDIFSNLEGDIADKYNAGTKATVRCFATAFYNLLKQKDIYKKLCDRSADLMNDGRNAQAKTYEQIYERTLKVFEQMVELLGDERMTVREFGQLLDAGLDEIRIGIIPTTTDYVQVGDITRSRVANVKALFLVGVNDGIVPQNASSGGLLTDDDKNFFMETHPELSFAPTAQENVYTQRLYLYMMLAKPSEHLYLSYARISQSGESIRPSYVIRTITNMFPNLRIEYDKETLMSNISDRNGSFRLISDMFKMYIDDMLSDEDKQVYEELTRYYCDKEEYKEKIKDIIERRNNQAVSSVSEAVAEVLYGTEIKTSITRLETYAKCAYEYFLKYGLGLMEREMFDFAANDLGTVFHSAIEIYANMLKERGIKWSGVTDEQAAELMDEAVEYAVASEDLAAIYSTRRQAYMVHRIKRIMHRTASVLKYHAQKGSFDVQSVEVDFSAISDLDALNLKISDENSIKLFGRIDRIDTCTEDGTTYVKIIDYKSGNANLELEAVYEGRQLQLVVYMDTALEMISKNTGNRTVPAGILYYHIDDPVIKDLDTTDVSEIEARIRKELKMTGYVNADRHIAGLMDGDFEKKSDIIPASYKNDGNPAHDGKMLSTEEFKELSKGAREAIISIGNRLIAGDISTAEEKGDLKKYPDTCDYCEYKSVCHQKENN